MIKTAIVPGSEVKYGHLTCVVLEDFEDSLLVLSPFLANSLPPYHLGSYRWRVLIELPFSL